MNNKQEVLDVLIIGAGFAGVHQLYHLRKLGYKVKVVEESGGLGGIWYKQSYPGARVDSPVPIYEFSMEEVWKEWNWSERFPTRDEILKYFAFVDMKLDLSKDIFFNTCVVSAEFDEVANEWVVKTEGGQVFSAKFLDLCVGFAAQPYNAPFQGMETFKGTVHHSNNWPKEVDVRGKKVAVIGTGATGVQIIQEMGPKVDHLTVFQRTPNLALPMGNYKLGRDQAKDKEKYPELFKLRLQTHGGFLYGTVQGNALDVPKEARDAFFEELWSHGDFHFWLAGYDSIFHNEAANLVAYEFWRNKVRARLHDPSMQDKLAPLTPPHFFGTKRPSLERNYYEVFNQSNVDLVDVRANPIDRFTPSGIRTKDGIVHKCDVVVLATGFDAVTGALHRIDIKGRGGVSLKEKWAQGIRTYLGMTSAGFPNLFFLYSAQAPTVFSNGLSCIEAQGDWVVECIDYVCKGGKSTIEAMPSAEEAFAKHVGEVYNMTLFAKTESFYSGANIPGKKREPLCYLGGLHRYIGACTESREKGYEGFVIAGGVPKQCK